MRALEVGMRGCDICGLVCETDAGAQVHCPRCAAPLHARKRHSISRAWAYLIAGVVLYIPANLLPVMYTQSLNEGITGSDNTILSGVIDFWHNDSKGIAVLIFVASILIPTTKIIVLALLLIAARRIEKPHSVRLIRMYRMLELIGYWSMLDVLVVGLVSSLVKFRGLTYAEPRVGILFFGTVVLLTMLATRSFDSRLLWDRSPGVI
jgi:paraquat-inducible protein A